MNDERPNIVVIGASAGGVEALIKVVQGLPHDLDAAVLVVMHVSSTASSALPQILSRSHRLAATHPVDGQRIQPGRIYVAPPDWHMMLRSNKYIELTRGPREHSCRPAIDPLFRSAALHFGNRAIGVILSGMLDDGTAGIIALKEAGGIAIAQDPKDSMFPAMPSSAIEHCDIDYVLPSAAIGELIGELCEQSVEQRNGGGSNAVEVRIDELHGSPKSTKELGDPSEFACPECGGVLWSIGQPDGVDRYRCRVGHAYSQQSLLESQSDAFERALWTAIRALREKADLARKVSKSLRAKSHHKSADRFQTQAVLALKEADALIDMIKQQAKVKEGISLSSDEPSSTFAPEQNHSASATQSLESD